MSFDEFVDLIPSQRQKLLLQEIKSDNFANIHKFLSNEYIQQICPNIQNIFACLEYFDPSETRVVIIGQDPYHIPGVANGLAFSTGSGKVPQSLINIYKEICSEYDLNYIDYKNSLTDLSSANIGDLSRRASQGVLLLNNCLSVEAHIPLSHSKIGWQIFTDSLISKLSSEYSGIVFMLWGSLAHSKANLIDAKRHLILKGVHPSPLSANRGFFGCGHFLTCNSYLQKINKGTIEWL